MGAADAGACCRAPTPRPTSSACSARTDVLVHHPYDSFSTSVEQFVEQAAGDPQVLAIKQTIYRTAGAESALVGSLVKAAEQGKQVVALVELKARFDEQANIARARVLEEAGVHVVYGLVGLKTHAKVLLVVRQEADGIRRYCHVGTGNYNPKTAHLYEDLGLLSADPDLGADLTDLFNHLTGYSHQGTYRKLLVAPSHLRRELADRIEQQAELGAAGRITLKMNSLVDPALIDMLYDASQRGTEIDLVVRGICCLRPQVPGLSDNIRVRSIVGRFLEHSRVYRFGADPETAEYLIGSADLMPRNLDHRVEALVPVTDPRLRARLAEMLELDLADDTLAWELAADGTWQKIPTVRRRLHPPRAPGAGDRSGAQLLTASWRSHRRTHERELKFTPGPSFRMPDVRRPRPQLRADAPDTVRLQAAYFDTADLRLARAGASLRYRNDEGWTVKLPGLGRRRARPLRDPRRWRSRRSTRQRRSTSCTRSSAASRSRSSARLNTAAPPRRAARRPTARSSPSWSTTRSRCSTARDSPRASASSRSSSPSTRHPGARRCDAPASPRRRCG